MLNNGMLASLVKRGIPEGSFDSLANNAHGHPQGDVFKFSPIAVAAAVFFSILTLLLVTSVQYTVGDLMTRLAMIESSTTTTIVESRPPPYSDEPDAPLEKKPLYTEADVEIVTIKHKPITSSVKATIKHLHRVGGFRGRWRGMRENIVYHALVNIISHGLARFLFRNAGHIEGQALGYIIAVACMCRFRMVWTHAMIAAPANKPWYKRYCSRKNARVLLLPTFIHILAAHATVLAPLAAWYYLDAFEYLDPEVLRNLQDSDLIMATARVLAGPAVFLVMTLLAEIPADAALSRVEACLLPEDDQTIVPFDRASIMGDIDITVKGAPGKLFSSAWKSVTFCTRLRVLGLWAKLALIQTSIILVNAMIVLGVFYVTGPEQLGVFAWMLMA